MADTTTFDIRTLTDDEAHLFGLAVAALGSQLATARADLAAARAREVAVRAENIGLAGQNQALRQRVEELQTANESANHQGHFGCFASRSDGWPGLAGEEPPPRPAARPVPTPAARSPLADPPLAVGHRDAETLTPPYARGLLGWRRHQ
jgi:hypothetical protein